MGEIFFALLPKNAISHQEGVIFTKGRSQAVTLSHQKAVYKQYTETSVFSPGYSRDLGEIADLFTPRLMLELVYQSYGRMAAGMDTI